MEYPPSPTGVSSDKWAKRQASADIATFIATVDEADIRDVDEPTGRKEVTVAYEDGREFIVEEGEAHGVYRERSGGTLIRLHIDWVEDEKETQGRTTIEAADLVDLEEGEYFV